MKFAKGNPKPKNSGRQKGTPNKRTIEVRSVIEGAAQAIGGMNRLVKWIKKAPENETLFWSQMYLLPRGSHIAPQILSEQGILLDKFFKELLHLLNKVNERIAWVSST